MPGRKDVLPDVRLAGGWSLSGVADYRVSKIQGNR